MELHQIRYFLAVARTRNFTRAAEECDVAQPSLTRAIKQLETELGGDLFRRERPQARLTDLGERMLPLLRQCYESAASASAVASAVKKGELARLRLALSHTIDLAIVVPQLLELRRKFTGLDLRLLRGDAAEVVGLLKEDRAEFALGSDLDSDWDRLDQWPLFEERFVLVLGADHRLAGRDRLGVAELAGEELIVRGHCEHRARISELLGRGGSPKERRVEIASDHDLVRLVEANAAMAILPASARPGGTVARAEVEGIDLRRSVRLYGVAGRQRSAAGSAFMRLLRAADWSQRFS